MKTWRSPRRDIEPLSHGVQAIRVYAFVLLVFPADIVIKALGAAAFPGGVVAMALFGWWVVATLLGQHDPRDFPNPIRLSMALVWVVTMVSYVAMSTRMPPDLQMNASDRWVMQIVGWTGVVFMAADSIRTRRDVHAIIRAVGWGGSIVGIVAMFQFWLSFDLAPFLRSIPGFSLNGDNLGIDSHGSLNRVAGTALHPIELGVVAAALLPLLLFNALHDKDRSRLARWAPVALVGVCIPITVSRSAIIAIVVVLLFMVPCLAPRQRLATFSALPFVLGGCFIAAPGLLGTLNTFFSMGSKDTSVQARQNDLPTVERLVHQNPWFGSGPGTYLAKVPNDNFDNQYYRLLTEIGVVGTFVFAFAYLVFPVFVALSARKRSHDPATRLLGGVLAGSAAVGIVVAFTFDSLGFSMYAGVQALVVGIVAGYWRLGRIEEQEMHQESTAAVPEGRVA